MLWPALVIALSQASAAAPASRPYDAQHYRIELRLKEDGAFENTVQVTLMPTRALGTVDLDSYGLDIQSVTQDGAEVPFTVKDDPAARSGVLTLKPKKALAAKKPVTFEIRYQGKAAQSGNAGFFTVKDADASLPPYYFTQFEPDYARRFFPCNDRPDDKATFELFAVVGGDQVVISNGRKTKDEAFTDQGKALRRVEWKQEQPIPPYLVAVAIGRFEPIEIPAAAKATLWVPPGRQDRTFTAQDVTTSHLSFEQAFVGVKYPWAKFDQVAVPRFIWGGMENASVVFARDNALVLDDKNHIAGRTRISSLIAHEMAHQWFGDLVTCKSWADIWLNEGFATYLTWKAEDDYYDSDMVEVGRAILTWDDYFRAEDGPRSHPLAMKAGEGADAFDAISYTKGALVVRMLEDWVGTDRFKAGIKAYLEKYAHSNASSADFFDTFQKATGTEKELKGFRNAWLYKRGYPVITPTVQWTGEKLKVTIRQKPNHADERGPFVFKLPVVFHRDTTPSYTKKEVILVDQSEVTVDVELPAAPNWINWNEGGSALVKIHGPAIAEQQWTAAARHDPDPVWRTRAVFELLGTQIDPDAREQVKPTDAAMDAVQYVLTKDPSPWVREAVLSQMARSQWKRLPSELGESVLALAKRPTGMGEDALGVVRVRRAALMALGKFDYKPGREYLFEQTLKPDLEINYFPAAARGTAHVGDSEALATLRAGIHNAKAKGYEIYKYAVPALGAFTSPEVIPLIRSVLADNAGDNALVSDLVVAMHQNRILLSAPELAGLVKSFVLEDQHFGDDLKARFVRLLDEVKTKDAKEALLAIAEKSDSAELQKSARQVLAKNFPGTAAGGTVKPAKGKKGQ
ncbi:MAG: M1 family metallopeptidase [Myxococcaceae bacterium]|nr:M1 family metallopeptidase [Myxococcaceae bacterium]